MRLDLTFQQALSTSPLSPYSPDLPPGCRLGAIVAGREAVPSNNHSHKPGRWRGHRLFPEVGLTFQFPSTHRPFHPHVAKPTTSSLGIPMELLYQSLRNVIPWPVLPICVQKTWGPYTPGTPVLLLVLKSRISTTFSLQCLPSSF